MIAYQGGGCTRLAEIPNSGEPGYWLRIQTVTSSPVELTRCGAAAERLLQIRGLGDRQMPNHRSTAGVGLSGRVDRKCCQAEPAIKVALHDRDVLNVLDRQTRG